MITGISICRGLVAFVSSEGEGVRLVELQCVKYGRSYQKSLMFCTDNTLYSKSNKVFFLSRELQKKMKRKQKYHKSGLSASSDRSDSGLNRPNMGALSFCKYLLMSLLI